MALGTFKGRGASGIAQLARRINVGPMSYGFRPAVPRFLGFKGHTPALDGLFRAGRVVGISQINAMATHVNRGSGG